MSSSSNHNSQLSNFIKSEAARIGFQACGISKAGLLTEASSKMEDWLSKGMHGDMGYLEKNKEKRYNPTMLVEGAQSVITVLYNYYPEKKLEATNNYQISKYAYGKDYHYIIKEKLNILLQQIEFKTGERIARVFVDSAPVMDRVWAQKSGLGFIGKNTLLINKKGGSFFFIGHIILDLELETDDLNPANYCGNCTRCLDACPTNALSAFEVDARKCISYLTIEYRGENLPEEKKDQFNNWIFGCDICQDVCPWNRFAKPHDEAQLSLTDDLFKMQKSDWQGLDKIKFNQLFKGSAVSRTRFKGLKRNIDFLKE